MKHQSTSIDHNALPALQVNQDVTANATEDAHAIEARRQYYYNNVLKPEGIPNPPNIQKPFSREETEQRAQAFKERNRSLKYFIGLIQQKVVK